MNFTEIKFLLEQSDDYEFINEMMNINLDSVKDPDLSLKIINAIINATIEYEIRDEYEDSTQSTILGICEIYVSYRTGLNTKVDKNIYRKSGILVKNWVDDKVNFFTCVDLIEYLDGNRNFSTFLNDFTKKKI